MRYALLLGCLIIWAGGVHAQTVKPIDHIPADRQVLDVHIGGRVVRHAILGGMAFEHQWPGVYFESRFEGDRVYLAFSDPWNEYRLSIDDLAPVTIAPPGEASLEIGDLKAGAHQLRLEKITESIDHAAAFDGFYIPADEKALPVSGRARQIEFIGDSSISGYGNLSTKRTCTSEEIRLTTDTQQGFAVLTAKHFDADYQINAISGRGLIRNYGGVVPDYAMSKVYPYVLLDKVVLYESKGWQPQIIVVKLDADFATPLNPGEQWSTPKTLLAEYWKAQASFAKVLHGKYPGAALLVFVPEPADLTPEQSKQREAWERVMTQAAQKIGIARIGFVPWHVAHLEGTACDYHGSLADHRMLATDLTSYIEAHPDLWQGH